MNKLFNTLLLALIFSLSFTSSAENNNSKANDNKRIASTPENLILITIDGLRWQEVFFGADKTLINHEKFVRTPKLLEKKFDHKNPELRKKLLMPFLWNTIAGSGVLIGDRTKNSKMSVSNQWHFSYPGYSEIYTGVIDPTVNSNKKVANPNQSFFAWLNQQTNYRNQVAVFGSWDVIPFIVNAQSEQLHINAGFTSAYGYSLSGEVRLLNDLQQEIPSPWHNVRLDSFTYRFAKDYLISNKPKVLVIAFGETDDFAHDGQYDSYLNSAHQTDKFIEDLWHTVQTSPHYKDKTVMMITTDHGRGSTSADWQHHASKKAVKSYMKNLKSFANGIVGSENIWFAAIGPNIANMGLLQSHTEFKQAQIAATALNALGFDHQQFNKNSAVALPLAIKQKQIAKN